jgi:hypothetical protein
MPGRRNVLRGLGALALLAEQGCRKFIQPASAVTLVLMDQTWLDNQFEGRRHQELTQFTKETGIRVELVPAPEGAVEQLDIWRTLLESGARIPDSTENRHFGEAQHRVSQMELHLALHGPTEDEVER